MLSEEGSGVSIRVMGNVAGSWEGDCRMTPFCRLINIGLESDWCCVAGFGSLRACPSTCRVVLGIGAKTGLRWMER